MQATQASNQLRSLPRLNACYSRTDWRFACVTDGACYFGSMGPTGGAGEIAFRPEYYFGRGQKIIFCKTFKSNFFLGIYMNPNFSVFCDF